MRPKKKKNSEFLDFLIWIFVYQKNTYLSMIKYLYFISGLYSQPDVVKIFLWMIANLFSLNNG
jgi:hypothetical protein